MQHMKTKLKITFLGSGSALGVPQIGCHCAVCKSEARVNKRRRTCFVIETGSRTFILDPGPDTRAQLLDHPLKRLDGVIITHAHHDHIGGYDDLRIFAIRQETLIPTLIHEQNVEELKRRCGYLFKVGGTYFAIDPLKEASGTGVFEGIPYRYLSYRQNGMHVTGYVIEDVAFVSDIQVISNELIEGLQGVETLIVSCLLTPHSLYKSHLNLDEINELKLRCGAKNVIITHMGHDIEYNALSTKLASDCLLSYDGFTYEV